MGQLKVQVFRYSVTITCLLFFIGNYSYSKENQHSLAETSFLLPIESSFLNGGVYLPTTKLLQSLSEEENRDLSQMIKQIVELREPLVILNQFINAYRSYDLHPTKDRGGIAPSEMNLSQMREVVSYYQYAEYELKNIYRSSSSRAKVMRSRFRTQISKFDLEEIQKLHNKGRNFLNEFISDLILVIEKNKNLLSKIQNEYVVFDYFLNFYSQTHSRIASQCEYWRAWMMALEFTDVPRLFFAFNADLLKKTSNILCEHYSSQKVKKNTIELFQAQSADMRPKLSNAQALSKDQVRIAIIDSTLDYKSHPSFEKFLVPFKKDHFGSYNYAEKNSDVWGSELFDSNKYNHGTIVTYSLYNVLGLFDLNRLEAGAYRLAFWRVTPFFDFLSSALGGFGPDNEIRFIDALDSEFSKPKDEHPQVLSMSFNIKIFKEYLDRSPLRDLLTRTKTLFVMAAGNEPVELKNHSRAPCFSDFPESLRPKDQILCVGAVKKFGQIKYELASFSTYGEGVDLYTLDSYYSGNRSLFFQKMNEELDEHPLVEGTSLAVPVISAVSAMILNRHPYFTATQIKEVLIEASEVMNLESRVYFKGPGLFTVSISRHVTGRVFDPETMLHRAFEIADRK